MYILQTPTHVFFFVINTSFFYTHSSILTSVSDIGDVFINLEQSYELSIMNKGDIVANWTFMPPHTRFGNKFTFYPKEGSLKPGEVETLSIRFESDILGEFSEFFRFALQGNENMLECNIKGHVIGPTFHFDTSRIDFGVVSFDYLHSQTVRLVNTSSIPIVFNLHIPQDGVHNKKEFNVTPSRGTLMAGIPSTPPTSMPFNIRCAVNHIISMSFNTPTNTPYQCSLSSPPPTSTQLIQVTTSTW